jgi:hypothetical protein
MIIKSPGTKIPMEQAPLERSRKFLPMQLEQLLCISSRSGWGWRYGCIKRFFSLMIKSPGTKMMVQAPLEPSIEISTSAKWSHLLCMLSRSGWGWRYGCIKRFLSLMIKLPGTKIPMVQAPLEPSRKFLPSANGCHFCVCSADLDGDGDMDVCKRFLSLMIKLPGTKIPMVHGTFGAQQEISTCCFDGARSVYAQPIWMGMAIWMY